MEPVDLSDKPRGGHVGQGGHVGHGRKLAASKVSCRLSSSQGAAVPFPSQMIADGQLA
jgi:hypothetical protein